MYSGLDVSCKNVNYTERLGIAANEGTETISESQHHDAAGLNVLFAIGKRPTRGAIKAFVARQNAVSLSHDPSGDHPVALIPVEGLPPSLQPAASTADDVLWLELLRDGLVFDLKGLAPGASCAFPEIQHRFDCAEEPCSFRLDAMLIQPGPHLATLGGSAPVARGMLALASDLIHHFPDLEAVYWPPSQSAIGRRFFESVITAWLDGGAFPALGLTAFRESIDGALQCVGLDFWIGQELRIEPPLSFDKVAATRLGVRLINQLVIVGGQDESERIIGPDGTRLVMRPSRNRRYVRVWRE